MDIKRAKQEIKDSIEAYLTKDEFGAYRIPAIRQRPVLLMGPPGIGKTQIMEQIAKEWFGCIYNYASYKTKCSRITIYQRKNIWRTDLFGNRIYDERNYCVSV